MRRRDVIGILAVGMAWPLAARAEQREGMRRLGVLMGVLEGDPTARVIAASLVQGLGALNWNSGGNLRIDWRWAGGDPALFERYAAELLSLGPDVLLAHTSPAADALRRRTSTVPIVFVIVTDPIGQGLAESLARPGGNITGFSNYDQAMAGKWLEMLTQISPPAERVAVLFNPATAPYAGLMLRAIEAAAASLSVTVQSAPVGDAAELDTMMASLAHERRGGLLVLPDSFTNVHREAIVALAARYRLPAVYPYRYYVADGGLMSYGIDREDLFRRSADYVARILAGTRAGDLPVQAPTKFELVINLRVAKALDILVTPTLVNTADEVIE